MRFRDVRRALGGGLAVYVLVAACSGAETALSSSGHGNATAGAGGAGGAGSGVGGVPDDGGMMDAIADALTDPVPDAMAAPPDVATEQCNQTWVYSGATFVYAEHAYPGKSVEDLAQLHTIGHYDAVSIASLSMPPGFDNYAGGAHITAGKAAVYCKQQGGYGFDTVTFVLPTP